jgi:hypothetical protein
MDGWILDTASLVESETSLLECLVQQVSWEALRRVFDSCIEKPDSALCNLRNALFGKDAPHFAEYDESTAFDLNEGVLVRLNGRRGQIETLQQACADAIGCCIVLHSYVTHNVEPAFRSTLIAMLIRFVVHIGGRAVFDAARFLVWLMRRDLRGSERFDYWLGLCTLTLALSAQAAERTRNLILADKKELPPSMQAPVAVAFDHLVSDPHHALHWRDVWDLALTGLSDAAASLEDELGT